MKLKATNHPELRQGTIFERDSEKGKRLIKLGWAIEVIEKNENSLQQPIGLTNKEIQEQINGQDNGIHDDIRGKTRKPIKGNKKSPSTSGRTKVMGKRKNTTAKGSKKS